jgi:hypothetical protein
MPWRSWPYQVHFFRQRSAINCKKPSHYKSNCFNFLRKNQAEGNHVGTKNGIAGSASDVVLNAMTDKNKSDCNTEEGLNDYTIISEVISVGNGNKLIAKKVGNLKCTVHQKNGEILSWYFQT